ncbi:hypothetical protein ACFVJM_30940 [Streptomyces virginiae]|uniref:hypothetical protein n=1 Tax=Streptomyces virginiae TaxID=1961 RepID=UPI00362B55AF
MAHLAVVPADTKAVAGDDATGAAWWSYEDLPPLAFDHGAILDAVRGTLSMETTTRLIEVTACAWTDRIPLP